MSDSKAPHEIQGVDITNMGSKDWKPSYAESDVAELYKKAHPTSWQDLLNYVEKKGDATWHITPGQAIAIKEDLVQVIHHNLRFANNPQQAYKDLHQYRGQDRKEEPKAEKKMQHESH